MSLASHEHLQERAPIMSRFPMRMSRSPIRRLVLVTTTVLVLGRAGAVAGAPPRPTSGDGQLALASFAPETGSLAPLRDSLRLPVELAIDEINAAGGVNGQPVSYATGDEGSEATTARATIARFADDGIDAVIGPAAPATVLTVLGDVRKARMLMCSGSDTLAPVTARSTDGLYFRTAPGPSLQGLALAELVLSDAHRRVGILRRADFFGAEVGTTLVHRLRKGGARIVADVAYNPARANVDAKVRAVVRRKPRAVVVIGFDDDAARIVASLIARGAGPGTVTVYGPDTMQSLGFAAAVDPADPSKVAGIKGTAPSPAAADASSPFHAVLSGHGADPIFSAHVYDCTILTALAAVKAKSDDPDKMKRALTKNLEGKKDCNTYAACKALLESGRSIHWRGASSRFEHFDGFEPGEGVYDTWSYDAAGQLVTGDPATQIVVP